MVLPAKNRRPAPRASIKQPAAASSSPAVAVVSEAPRRLASPRSQGTGLVPRPRPTLAASDLEAANVVARQYLFGGSPELALAIYDGLSVLAPKVAYYQLALGLAHDMVGDHTAAMAAYRRAAALNPRDPLPDLDLAELHLARKERELARPLLQRAAKKALDSGARALADKANALITHLDRA